MKHLFSFSRWLGNVSEIKRRARRPVAKRVARRLSLEALEERTLLSASAFTAEAVHHHLVAEHHHAPVASAAATAGTFSPDLIVLPANHKVRPDSGNGPGGGFTPSQIRTAYNFPTSLNGSGETIAIVDAYGDANILSDVNYFSNYFGLPQFNASGGPTFSQVDQNGNTVPLGTALVPSNTSWATEIALDVEWAHAIAPQANIVLVESADTGNNMFTAVQTAGKLAPVVSMSWGGGEFSGETGSPYDTSFNPSSYSHPVTFVASSGDYGAPPSYPAVSPYVVSVGGTSLTVTSTNTWSSEKAWGNGGWTPWFGGTGGGVSRYEARPSYQPSTYHNGSTVKSSTTRINPDVSYDANPNTGFSVYDSTGSGGWVVVGGTSDAAPQWAGLIALADQGRATALSSTQTLTDLYGMASSSYATYFHDITSGSINGYSAGPGYDAVTGLGTPIANQVISYLETH